MTLPGHEGAFKGPPMALGGNPWAPVPEPRGPPDSCTSTFFPVFGPFSDFPRPDEFFRPGPP
ncbi:hypothetical protein BVRB_2g037300 [Beta vulgaris subsp. vulgaris]|nr:hypothetical protein BVRB_2g037300 [Beta vulgaris subsp. vulgaris]